MGLKRSIRYVNKAKFTKNAKIIKMSSSSYDIPSWAGKPPTGLHLDVLKDGKLIQKLMIDEKKCYLFGRNPQMNDFTIDHNSCSRVHSALVYHKHLSRCFLVDLGSTHGTFIGNILLEKHKPTQLQIDSRFRFGASTRQYIIRERPQAGPRPIMEELEKSSSSDTDGRLMGLPETETELDNLTEFNTAHNRRITMIGIPDEPARKKGRKIRLTFNEEEMVINPEDVDPSIGRFRNMIESTVIPKKRARNDMGISDDIPTKQRIIQAQQLTSPTKIDLYDDLPALGTSGLFASSLSTKLGLPLPNPAPDIDMNAPVIMPPPGTMASASAAHLEAQFEDPDEPKRKKYAKEAWPGKKP